MKINLRKKKLKNGKYSLYLEYYKGSTKTPDGKQKHIRDFEYLKIYLHQNPKNAQEKRENKEQLALAEKILAIKKAEFFQGKYELKSPHKSKVKFLEYFIKLKEERFGSTSTSNYNNWDSAYKQLIKYCPANLTFNEVNEDFVLGFKNFLENEARTSANRLLSANSKYSYYNKFRTVLKEAFDNGYIMVNLARKVKSFEQVETKREYLTHEEVQALANTECLYPILKTAFLFSCLTGIRWSDINKMIWEEIRDEEKGCKIVFRQQKTEGQEYLYISKQARELLGKRKNENERVFTNLQYRTQFNIELLRWVMRAGITKHITFHCARHTHAVLLLENGADIYTVSKLLGHRELRTTQIYAKMVDKKMKEASNLIPEIQL